MSMESDLFDALKGLVASRVYPDQAPESVQSPYIVFTQVGGPSPAYVENLVPNIRGARMQISVWGTERIAVNALALQIEALLIAATNFQARPVGAFTASMDPDTELRGTRQDFYIWSAR